MIKRIGPIGLLFLGCIILPVFLRADWKSDLNLMLKENDYKQALSLLETTLKEMESADRQEALALLPFIYSKNNLPDEEKRLLLIILKNSGIVSPCCLSLISGSLTRLLSTGENGARSIR